MKNKINVGDKVIIREGWRAGDWGKVIMIDKDGFYHVSMFEAKDECPIFERSELRRMTK